MTTTRQRQPSGSAPTTVRSSNDLPDPVAPATRRSGARRRSKTAQPSGGSRAERSPCRHSADVAVGRWRTSPMHRARATSDHPRRDATPTTARQQQGRSVRRLAPRRSWTSRAESGTSAAPSASVRRPPATAPQRTRPTARRAISGIAQRLRALEAFGAPSTCAASAVSDTPERPFSRVECQGHQTGEPERGEVHRAAGPGRGPGRSRTQVGFWRQPPPPVSR